MSPQRIARMVVAIASLLMLGAAPASAQVRVGSKNFTEQFIVAEIYAQALEAAGIKVERKINLGGTLIAQKALEEKQIDLYPEYTGTMLLAVLKLPVMTDKQAVYDKVKAEYAAKGLVLLNQSPMNNTYNMVVRPETAAQYKLETLSDLAKVSKELKLGAGPEFRDRADGLPGLKAKYGIEFKEDLQMAIGLRYQALAGKQIDVVNGYATDGMISALKLKRLKDDKNLWPPYYLVPVVRKEALDANPQIAEVLNRVDALLDEADHGRDELQGRRREGRAEGRRARVPEGEGHRSLSLRKTDMTTPAIVLTGAGVTVGDVVRVSRAHAPVEVATVARERAGRGAQCRRPPRAIRHAGLWRQLGIGRQYRQADCPGRSCGLPAARRAGARRRCWSTLRDGRRARHAVHARLRDGGRRLRCVARRPRRAARDAQRRRPSRGAEPGFDRRRRLGAAVAPVPAAAGEGTAEYRGEVLPGAEALARAGLQPVATRGQGRHRVDQRKRRDGWSRGAGAARLRRRAGRA